MIGKCFMRQEFENTDILTYAHTSAVTAWTPIFTPKFGVLIPKTSALINTATTYYQAGRFNFVIYTGITVTQGDVIYYITASGLVTNVNPGFDTGFPIGTAFEDGSAVGDSATVMVGVQIFIGLGNTVKYQALTAAGELMRVWGTDSATSGTFRGISVRTFMNGSGTPDGESLRAYTLINGTVTGSGIHGAHITAQIGPEDAASTANCTGEVSGVRATIGIGLTNTAPVGGTIASIRLDSYFLSTASSASSSYIYACDVGGTYGVKNFLQIGAMIDKGTTKSAPNAYTYVSGGVTVTGAACALRMVTPDGTFYLVGYASING